MPLVPGCHWLHRCHRNPRADVCVLQSSVGEQLDALLDRSPVCAPARLQSQRADNEELQEEVDSLQKQLARSQARNRQLEQHLAAAQLASEREPRKPTTAV
jgi:hypothetical protein